MISIKPFIKCFTFALCCSLFFTSAAKAELITAYISGNDCSGYFNQPDNDPDYNGFSACWVFSGEGESLELYSPVIMKFNEGLGAGEISQRYPSIDGSEWMFSGTTEEGGWTYTPNDEDDPGIFFWAAKAGNGFNLFWNVGEGADCSDALSAACLEAAQLTSSGTWITPLNSKQEPRGLSHLTFYNGGRDPRSCPPEDPDCNEPPQEVPETGSLALLALGMLGLLVGRRRQ